MQRDQVRIGEHPRRVPAERVAPVDRLSQVVDRLLLAAGQRGDASEVVQRVERINVILAASGSVRSRD